MTANERSFPPTVWRRICNAKGPRGSVHSFSGMGGGCQVSASEATKGFCTLVRGRGIRQRCQFFPVDILSERDAEKRSDVSHREPSDLQPCPGFQTLAAASAGGKSTGWGNSLRRWITSASVPASRRFLRKKAFRCTTFVALPPAQHLNLRAVPPSDTSISCQQQLTFNR